MATEYISRDAALACFSDWIDRYGHEHTADEMVEYQRIEDLPVADVVEVVRCRDCKNFIENPNDCISGYGLTGPEPMDFCPYGERRANNG